MAAISTFSCLGPVARSASPSVAASPSTYTLATSLSATTALRPLRIACMESFGQFKCPARPIIASRKTRALAAEESVIPEEVSEEAPAAEQPVSVPVSPSDILTMFFQAEGTMNESSIPAVAKAIEELEGISDLKVQVIEGIASVELSKQTTVQATGVASNLVEVIQGSGFKLQTLNLSFEDEEDAKK